MKSLFSRIISVSLALVLAGSAFAANGSHKENFQIGAPAQVNGTVLPAGDYEARWEGSGPALHVNTTQGRKVIATVPAQLVNLQKAAYASETEIKSSSNGDREPAVLRFSGRKYALELGSETAKTQTKTDSPSR